MGIKESLQVLVITLIASVVLVLISVVYFGITLWIVKAGSTWFFGSAPDANWAVLSASILTVGSIMAGAVQRRGSR